MSELKAKNYLCLIMTSLNGKTVDSSKDCFTVALEESKVSLENVLMEWEQISQYFQSKMAKFTD